MLGRYTALMPHTCHALVCSGGCEGGMQQWHLCARSNGICVHWCAQEAEKEARSNGRDVDRAHRELRHAIIRAAEITVRGPSRKRRP